MILSVGVAAEFFRNLSGLNMKLLKKLTLSLALFHSVLAAQSADVSQGTMMGLQGPKSAPVPPYVTYRHFLNWVYELDKAAGSSATDSSYKFAQPFTRVNLQNKHLDLLRNAAHHLDADLQQHQTRVQQVVTRYRAEARAALAQGKGLPPAPTEIRDLSLQETALLIHHYVSLRISLGPDASAQLDRYLAYEFAPHIKLKGIVPSVNAQTAQ